MGITVIGDVLLDRDIEGSCTRCVPDSSAPVIDVERSRSRAGGAGLVARMLADDGHDVTLVTVLSDDQASWELRKQLTGINLVAGPSGAPTPIKTRILQDGSVSARVDEGCAPAPVPNATWPMLAAIQEADVIVVADYGRGLLNCRALRRLIAELAKRVPVVWDPHLKGAAPVPGVSAVTPNRGEALRFAGVETDDKHGVARAASRLMANWQAKNVVITLGSEGAWLQTVSDGRQIPAAPLPDVDVCGAGDRFTAALAIALPDTDRPSAAVAEAIAVTGDFLAGGGVAALPPVNNTANPARTDQAPGLPDAAEVVRLVHAAGGTVVATGGCFDLLHAGHLRTLRAARAKGDALIVCLNSDESVRRLKGLSRPLMSQDDRAELLLGLDCVDAVAIFGEDTPLTVLARLRPDIWVKGGDYIAELLPEHELMAGWGGSVQIVPFHPGRSTTALADSLKHAAGLIESTSIE
ncbi:PfkB family carbohydrate kinase [Propionimicrobium sp. PCR01-08-3]|uniref:PfkB family carbohydrate kinase n=1 Tax=Propionimicrobium sp. PCR01-08-3 TaxID=3052086 RepID=UPI00255C7378|nr:PfkB family carbohydrate kinase [Propionimicrobium sp. PCR01-08-3]WIY82168.1 PfkB family carbohydrate kinase [Propionimicrobium sp. PCR01-08-3]